MTLQAGGGVMRNAAVGWYIYDTTRNIIWFPLTSDTKVNF